MTDATALRPLAQLSICEVVVHDAGLERLPLLLRQLLGVTFPAPNGAFIAGTRSVLRPDLDARAFVITEGESESVLYRRLLRAVPLELASVFDASGAYAGYRFEGSAETVGALSVIDPDAFAEGSVHRYPCGHVAALLHRREVDRWDFYIPRSQADVFCRMFARIAAVA